MATDTSDSPVFVEPCEIFFYMGEPNPPQRTLFSNNEEVLSNDETLLSNNFTNVY